MFLCNRQKQAKSNKYGSFQKSVCLSHQLYWGYLHLNYIISQDIWIHNICKGITDNWFFFPRTTKECIFSQITTYVCYVQVSHTGIIMLFHWLRSLALTIWVIFIQLSNFRVIYGKKSWAEITRFRGWKWRHNIQTINWSVDETLEVLRKGEK